MSAAGHTITTRVIIAGVVGLPTSGMHPRVPLHRFRFDWPAPYPGLAPGTVHDIIVASQLRSLPVRNDHLQPRRRHVSLLATRQCLLLAVASTGDRNTLTFLRRWSVGHEAAAADLLFGGSTG